MLSDRKFVSEKILEDEDVQVETECFGADSIIIEEEIKIEIEID
jgi:hypothetical protein